MIKIIVIVIFVVALSLSYMRLSVRMSEMEKAKKAEKEREKENSESALDEKAALSYKLDYISTENSTISRNQELAARNFRHIMHKIEELYDFEKNEKRAHKLKLLNLDEAQKQLFQSAATVGDFALAFAELAHQNEKLVDENKKILCENSMLQEEVEAQKIKIEERNEEDRNFTP